MPIISDRKSSSPQSEIKERGPYNPYMTAGRFNTQPGVEVPDVGGITATANRAIDSAISPFAPVGNFLLDTLENLDRPRNALAVGVREAYQGGDILEGVRKGWMLEDAARVQDALPDWFKDEYPIGSKVTGIVGDIVTDPLTYVPFGAVKSGVTKAKEAAMATKPIQRASKMAADLMDNRVAQALNIHTGKTKAVKEVSDKWRIAKQANTAKAVDEARALDVTIRDLANRMNLDPGDLKSQIFDAVETGNLHSGTGLLDEVGSIEKRLIDQNARILSAERAAGIDVGDLGSGYMAHVQTPEAKRAMAKEVSKAKRKEFFSGNKTQHASTLQRKIEGTVAEINAERIYGTNKFFYDDPVIAQSVRNFRHAQAMSVKSFADDMQRFGMQADVAPSDWKAITGIDELKGLKFHPDVAHLVKHNYKMLSPEETGKFLKYYNGATKWWKMWALGARPAYHSRNVVGNLWNNYFGGVLNPEVYGKAAKLQKAAASGRFANQADEAVWAAMRERGVIGLGQYGGDFATSLADEVSGLKSFGSVAKDLAKNPVKALDPRTTNPVLQLGFRTGQALEENARIAHFLNKVAKGASFDDAAKSVKKYLFDYGDLSPFEQKIKDLAIPFYTWSRKNIPLQVEILLDPSQYGKLQKLNIVRHNIEYGTERPDPRHVPDYIKNNVPIYLPDEEDGQKRSITLMNYLPLADVNRLSDPGNLIGQMVNPLPKTIAELSFNYDSFRQKPIRDYKGQGTDFLGIRMPVEAVHSLRNLVMLNEIDRANPGGIFGTSSYNRATGERTRTRSYGMDDFQKWGELFDVPIGPGAIREARTDLESAPRLLQYLSGIREYPFSPTQEEKIAIYKYKEEIGSLKKQLKRAIVGKKADTVREITSSLSRTEEKLNELLKERPVGR